MTDRDRRTTVPFLGSCGINFLVCFMMYFIPWGELTARADGVGDGSTEELIAAALGLGSIARSTEGDASHPVLDQG